MGAEHASTPRTVVLGLILTGVGIINLAANACWLRTGDIHRPGAHIVMRGGWPGFWFTTILFGAALIAGLVLLAVAWRRRARG